MRLHPVLRLAAALAAVAFPACAQQPAPAALPQANARITAAVGAGAPADHATLAARRDLLLNVFRQDPASARTYALPRAIRQALLAADPTTAPLLEYEVTKTGELAAAVADNWTDGTSTTRYTLHTPTAELDLELPATVLATAPANHHVVTVHGLALADVVAADTLNEAAPADAQACAPPVSSRAATTSNTAAPLTCSPLGNQRIAVLIVKFPNNSPAYPTGLDQAAYWNTVLFGQNPSVNTYWQEVSQGQTYATGDVYGPIQLATQYDCTTTSAMQTAAIAAAAGTVDFSQYSRIVIVYPVTTCTFGGLGNVGCVSATAAIGHQYSVVWLPITANYKADFSFPQMWGGTSHELGHNLGMNHANTLDFNAISLGPLDFSTTNPGTVVGYGGGTGAGSNLPAVNTEYGDNFDVMGYPWISGGPYNAVHRSKILGWIPQTDERDVTASGQYTLVPAENASGLRALHVLRDPASTAWLWVEYHQATSYYESNNYSAHIGYTDTETTGAQIHYETPITAASTAYTYLLDMTPVATATNGQNNFYDGTLAPGKSWSDPYSLLTLTAGSQTSGGLGVTVSYDQPCAAVALNASTIPAAGGAGTLTITAPGSCTWTVSSNALWITFPGATSGSGSAVVAFNATANTTTLQRDTWITAQRQSLALVQPGSTITLSALAPNAGNSVAGTPTPFALSYSDGLGLADVSQLNFDFTGFGTPDCQIAVVQNGANPYLYLFANGVYSNPGIAVGSSGTLTSPSCTLSGVASSWKSSGNAATLTLGLTFTGAFLGAHNALVSAYSNNGVTTATVPLGIWTVTAAAAASTATTTTIAGAGTATYGTPYPVSSTVAPGAASGSVAFVNQGASPALASGTLIAGNASATINFTAAGTYSLQAIYSGDRLYTTSTSPSLAVTVAQAGSSTRLTAAPQSDAFGSTLTLTAAITSPGGTGSVNFMEGSTLLGTSSVAQGAATLALSTLSAGTHNLTAVYSGDANVLGSTSPTAAIVVNQAMPTVVLTPSAASIATGATLTLSVAITPGAATGVVTFYDNNPGNNHLVTLGPGTLQGGIATFSTSSLAVGTHSLGAIYAGDANVTGGASNIAIVVVTGVQGTTTTLTSSATAIVPSGSVTLTARVAPGAGTAQPGGTVNFLDGAATVGSATLNAGTASYTLTGLAAGNHLLSAIYLGSPGSFSGSPSNAIPVVVAKLSTNFAVTGSASTVFAGAFMTLTAAPSTSGGAQTAGSMTFTDGSATLATVALNNGSATFTTSGLAAGSHSFGAVYSGSVDLTGATGAPLAVAVQDFALTAPTSSATLNAGTGESFPLTLAPGSAGFSSAITLSCSGAPAQSTCSVSPGSITPGASPATATLTLTTTARPAPSAGWLLLGLAPGLLAFRRRNWRTTLLTLCAALTLLTLASGCGQGNFTGAHPGAGGSGTPAGSYPLTITGTATGATTLVHSTTVNLLVN